MKNNLERTSSLLELSLDKQVPKDVIDTIQNRIYSMALIHKKLQHSDRLDQVNVQDYLMGLLNSLAETYRAPDKDIHWQAQVQTDARRLSIHTTTDLGLVINELVSNAYKYAFPNQNKGEIVVKIAPVGEKQYSLTVSDNGIGLPAGLENRAGQSLGLHLVGLLVKRLGVQWL
ncbi:MAG: sensor histidine kinase [Bacteroidia bacterium]|nr:sensor histidine kinase [Bacteroidia bacterium]